MTVAQSANTTIAFDRASARSLDADGRMRVRDCVITVAEINPYYGREIPGHEELGLTPSKVYELYRDPSELEAAVEAYIHYYNNDRITLKLKGLSPVQYRTQPLAA